MRILVVANLYPSAAHPAFGSFVGARVGALRRAGVDVVVTAITNPAGGSWIPRKYAGLLWRASRAAIGTRIRGRRFDVVEAHIAFPTGIVAWPVAWIAGARLVLFAHGSDVLRLPWRSRLRAAVARLVFRRAALVVANSRYTAAAVEQRLGPLRRPAVVVSPGVELPSVEVPSAAAPTSGARSGIVFVGRLVPGKGVDGLIEALRILPAPWSGTSLTIAGDGPERARLEVAARAARSVTFLGSIPPSQIAPLLEHAAVLAAPSVEAEGLGLAALEGMAHGAIVVGTPAGGLAEVIEDGRNGILAPIGDVDGLARALARALEMANAPEGDAIRAAARATAEKHDVDAAAQQTVALFESLT